MNGAEQMRDNRASSFWGNIDLVAVFRGLFIAQIIALMISPPATSIFELFSVIVFFLSPVLRKRLADAVRQPFVVMSLVLFVFFGIGLIYSVDSIDHTLRYWLSWRRLLLIPLAVAAFDDDSSKEKAAWVLFWALVLGAFLSFGTYLMNTGIYRYTPGIVIRNHTTQGMLFVVGAFSSFLMLRFRRWHSPFQRWTLLLVLLLTASNVLLINTSRSTYLGFIVLTAYGIMMLLKGWQRVFLPVLGMVAVAGLFWTSPIIHQRVEQTVREAMEYENAADASPIRSRMIFLENTLQMIKEKPVFGYGTGGFKLAYGAQAADKDGWRGGLTDDPHNQFLKIYIENGLVGLLLFLMFIVSAFHQKVPLLWKHMGGGVLLLWCTTSFFNSHFSTFSEGHFLMMWCGIMLSMHSRGETLGDPG